MEARKGEKDNLPPDHLIYRQCHSETPLLRLLPLAACLRPTIAERDNSERDNSGRHKRRSTKSARRARLYMPANHLVLPFAHQLISPLDFTNLESTRLSFTDPSASLPSANPIRLLLVSNMDGGRERVPSATSEEEERPATQISQELLETLRGMTEEVSRRD